MNYFGTILGIVGMVLIIDAVLALGFGEKYITLIVDYVPIEYTNFAYDVVHSPLETQLFMRIGEIFMGSILILLAQEME